jgi:D-cysteine desulfhydrase
MNLARFPRRNYLQGRSPVELMPRFTEALGGATIYIKRDDILGFGGGGNKLRKLEFVVADALAQGADTLITGGAVQSNHCRLTLAAAKKEGLACRLILEERVPGSYKPDAGGNNFLYGLLGVEKKRIVPGGTDMLAEIQKEADELAKIGRKGYVIPVGASTPLGALGYVACAEELLSQSYEMRTSFDHVVTASGSSGTHAGLVVGLYGNNSHIPVTGINISRPKDTQEERVFSTVQKTAAFVGLNCEVPRSAVNCFAEYMGPGYSLPTPGMVEAVKLAARTEGILLDPVYTGKAMAGLIDLVRKGYFKKGEKVLFIHTGGSPALFAYMDALRD